MGYSIVLKKNETATMFLLNKPSLVNRVNSGCHYCDQYNRILLYCLYNQVDDNNLLSDICPLCFKP